MATSAAVDSKHDSAGESSDERLNKKTIEGGEVDGIEELGPSNVRFVGSQKQKLRHVYKASQHPDSDRSDRKREEYNDIVDSFVVMDPASAQCHADSDDSSRDCKPRQENHHHSPRSAKIRTEFPVFSGDTSRGARCETRVEQQPLSNRRGSPRTKVPGIMTPHSRLRDFGENSCMIPEGKGNEWLCCGIEHQPGESPQEVRRSGNWNEVPNVEEAPIPSKYYGSNPFEKNWEQRTPVGQKKREFGMFMSSTNCEALLAIDALLEEDDDTVEVNRDRKNPATQPRDLQLPAEQQVTGSRRM